MIEGLGSLIALGATSFLSVMMVKGAALLAAVLLPVRLCGVRHAIWKSLLLRSTIVGMLLLPLGAVVLPPVGLPLLPADSGPLQPVQVVTPDILAGPTAAVVETFGASSYPNVGNVLFVVYSLGLLLLLARLVRSARFASAIRRSAQPITSTDVLNRWRVWKRRLGVRRDLPLAHSARVTTPTQLGLVAPVVVLPTSMVAGGRTETLDMVMIHELAHVLSHDCVYRLLSMLARAIYWPIPLVWTVARKLTEAQEQMCDDWAVDTSGDPDGYAGALLDIASQAPGRPSLAFGLEMARIPHVLGRVERVAKAGRKVRVRVNGVASLVVVLVLTASIGTVAALKSTVRSAKRQSGSYSAWGPALTALAAMSVGKEDPIRTSRRALSELSAALPLEAVEEVRSVLHRPGRNGLGMSVADLAELQISDPVWVRSRPMRIVRPGTSGSPSSIHSAASRVAEEKDLPQRKVRKTDSTEQWQDQLGPRSVWRGDPVGFGQPLASTFGQSSGHHLDGVPRLVLANLGYLGPDVVQPLEHRVER